MKTIKRQRPEVAPTAANINRFVRMLRSQARRLAAAESVELCDAQQEIAIMVIEALADYDSHKGPVKYWVKRWVNYAICPRVRRQQYAKRRPHTWEYDQVVGWHRERAQVVSDLEILDSLPATVGSESATTPEDHLIRNERRDRFRSAINAAEVTLRQEYGNAKVASLVMQVFRARVSEAAFTGSQKFEGLADHLRDSLGVSRYVERRHWRRGREALADELRKRGELS